MFKRTIPLWLIGCVFTQVQPTEGLHEHTPATYALTHVRIVKEPGTVIENGTVIFKNGIITAVGENAVIPQEAIVLDYTHRTVYAGFIESYWKKEIAKNMAAEKQADFKSKNEQKIVTSHWSEKVHPELNILEYFKPTEKELTELRKLGFTTAQIVPEKGIFRGRSSLIHLGDWNAFAVINEKGPAQFASFEHGDWSEPTYPGSLMGAIALFRQTIYDAQWYANAWNFYNRNREKTFPPEKDRALETLEKEITDKTPFCFETDQELMALRVNKVCAEFALNFWLKGSGYEYRRLNELKQFNPFIILPLNYPEKPDVDSWEDALDYSLEQLRHWDMAPDNAARIAKAGLEFALTSTDLKNSSDFRTNLIRSVERGFPKEQALAALTTVPAAKLGLSKQGKIEKGFVANLVLTDGDYFEKKTKVKSVWIQGKEFIIEQDPLHQIAGKWNVYFKGAINTNFSLELKQTENKVTGTIKMDTLEVKLSAVENEVHRLTLTFPGKEFGFDGTFRISGTMQDSIISGYGNLPDGEQFKWSATRVSSPLENETEKSPESLETASTLNPLYPDGEYGFSILPEMQNKIWIKNATIWTSGKEGILYDTDMYINNGIIEKIGKNLKISGSDIYTIDGKGKHITPGLIDAHNHSSAFAINEGTQSVTSEVRIYDVIDSDDIDIYRQLSGGLTAANVLHGSANAIGGQNAVIKLRWGKDPDGILFKEAPQGIKFALGENVKQSNWGEKFTTRYPQTRMGVEQIIRDAFASATDYAQTLGLTGFEKKADPNALPVRKELELDALVEIMQGKRLVHAHSYRQDEILMLTRIAEDFGFKIATFQHVLEGYKIAERIAEHGAGASTFTDWWAYKFEVIDAIPFNGAIMNKVGVVTSFNSDSNELARRLNTEAAKAVKYGDLPEEEALKFVTINPAKQLKIDQYVGSLEKGKQGDFVIWNGNPLSVYTSCEETWIEGTQYFSKHRDSEIRKQIETERNMLIQKILTAESKNNEQAMKPNGKKHEQNYSCSAGGAQ